MGVGKEGGGKWSGEGGENAREEGAVAPGVGGGAGYSAPTMFAESQGGGKETRSRPLSQREAQAHPPLVSRLWGAGGCRVRLAAAPRVGDFIAMGR